MCEIYGMSETDLGWEGSIKKKVSSIGELNGRKYKVTILHQDTMLAGSIYKHGTHGCSLQNRSVTNSRISSTKVDASVDARLTYEWGGKDGNKVSAGASAKAHDDKGTYVKIEIDRNSDGEGKAEVSAGIRKE